MSQLAGIHPVREALRGGLPLDRVLIVKGAGGPRLQELIDGHESGLKKLVELCAEPKRAVDTFPALFRAKITSGNFGMATGESLAHLNCLRARGEIERSTDAEGIDWYQAKGAI